MGILTRQQNKPSDVSIPLFVIILFSFVPAIITGFLLYFTFEWQILDTKMNVQKLNMYYAFISGVLTYFIALFMGILFGRNLYMRLSTKSVNVFKAFSEKLHKANDHEDVYQVLYEYLSKLYKKTSIYIYYRHADEAGQIKWSHLPKSGVPICEMTPKKCPVLLYGKNCYVSDIKTDITCAYQYPFFKQGGYICLKVSLGNHINGVVQLYHPEKDYFDKETVADIKTYVQLVEPILREKSKIKNLNIEVYTDKLTQVKNRTYFDIQIDNMLKDADYNAEAFSVIIIDLDYFKKINDTYGHPAGDCVLSEFAKILTSCIRGEDTVVRYGGEEFVILLPKSSQAYATQMGEKIRRTVATSKMPMFEGVYLPQITCSLGISTYPDYANDKTSLLKTADMALYSAKRNGRNCVVAYDPYKNQVDG